MKTWFDYWCYLAPARNQKLIELIELKLNNNILASDSLFDKF